jgi:hypothetical protein
MFSDKLRYLLLILLEENATEHVELFLSIA